MNVGLCKTTCVLKRGVCVCVCVRAHAVVHVEELALSSHHVSLRALTQAVRLGSKCFYLLNCVGLRMSLLYKGLFFIILNYVSVCFCMWVVLGQKMLQTKLGSSAKAMLEPYG